MKILIWDVETSYYLVTTFSLFKPYLGHHNIKREAEILCVGWKWLGQPNAQSANFAKGEKRLLERVHKVLSEADVLVAHNGDKFDLRRFNAAAIRHGLQPLEPRITVDTLKVARKYFGFISNRLDYLGRYLGVGKKIRTEDGLWDAVMDGDRQALKRMEEYCRGDVELLERVYLKLKPYMTNHPTEQSILRARLRRQKYLSEARAA